MVSNRIKGALDGIIPAMILVAGLTVVVKLCSIGKELIVAGQYGIGDALDVYFVALMLPQFLISVVAGSFSASFLPAFVRTLEADGEQAAQKLLSNSLYLAICVVLITSAAICAVFPIVLPILASGFSPEKSALAQSLFWIVSPTIVLTGIASVWTNVLHAQKRFALASITPVISPLAIALFAGLSAAALGPAALAYGTLLGAAAEAALVGLGLRSTSFVARPKWYGWDAATRQVANQLSPVAIGQVLMGLTLVVDQAFAASLGAGSVSSLNYGYKMVAVIASIASIAIGTAVTPYFAQQLAQQKFAQLRLAVTLYLKRIFVAAALVSITLIAFSLPLTKALFMRGAFDRSDAEAVSGIQQAYALQLPFFVCGILLVRLIACFQANHLLAIISACALGLNILLDAALIQLMGTRGIALASVCVYATTMILSLVFAHRLFEIQANSRRTEPLAA